MALDGCDRGGRLRKWSWRLGNRPRDTLRSGLRRPVGRCVPRHKMSSSMLGRFAAEKEQARAVFASLTRQRVDRPTDDYRSAAMGGERNRQARHARDKVGPVSERGLSTAGLGQAALPPGTRGAIVGFGQRPITRQNGGRRVGGSGPTRAVKDAHIRGALHAAVTGRRCRRRRWRGRAGPRRRRR